MKRSFISDTHFSHTNVIKYTGRSFETVEEMNRYLIDNWNDCVDANDQVFFLGDFGLGSAEHLHSFCSQLKGNKICIRGNHDRNPSWLMRIGFHLVLESAFIKRGELCTSPHGEKYLPQTRDAAAKWLLEEAKIAATPFKETLINCHFKILVLFSIPIRKFSCLTVNGLLRNFSDGNRKKSSGFLRRAINQRLLKSRLVLRLS